MTPRTARIVTVVIGCLVATLDYVTPADYDVGLFYVVAIATSAFSGSRRFLWSASGTFISLVFLLARFGAPPLTNWYMVWSNRTLSALSLLIVAGIVHSWMRNLSGIEVQRTLIRRLLETLDLAQVIIRKLDGTILFWSYGAELLYGWSAEEAVGKMSHTLLRTDFGAETLEEANGRLKRDWQWIGEIRHIRKGHVPVWVISHWTLELSELFQFPIVTQIDHDISDMRPEENRFRSADAIPHLVWLLSPSGQMVYANQSWRDYFGRDPRELADMRTVISNFVHPEDAPGALSKWEKTLNAGQVEPWKCRYCRHDGTYRWFSVRMVAITNEPGEVIRWIATATDLHDENDPRRYVRTRSSII